jgi:putative endonuclease
MRTERQQAGDAAEALVAARLTAIGWSVLGRQVRAGRCEIDIVALDPGPPRRLVAVEVRWRARRDFGLPEETFDWRKRERLVRACQALRARGLPGGQALPAVPMAVDLIVVEPPAADGAPIRVRHHRDALIG